MSTNTITGWEVEFNDERKNSHKFYRVFVSDNNVLVKQWGRIGTAGQTSVSVYSSYSDTMDQGMKSLYEKRAKGYVEKNAQLSFTVDGEVLYHVQREHPGPLVQQYLDAVKSGAFGAGEPGVHANYDTFADQAKALMDRATRGDDLVEVMEDLEKAREVWASLTARHAEIAVVLEIAETAVAQRFMATI